MQKTTAAYYELVFGLTPAMGKTQNIKIKCTRPGVRVHSVKRITGEKTYVRMKPVEKKLFALCVANRGAWSRMVARICISAYDIVKTQEKRKKTFISIRVPIPESLRNMQVDIFIIRTGKQRDKTDFDFTSKKTASVETVAFRQKKGPQALFRHHRTRRTLLHL